MKNPFPFLSFLCLFLLAACSNSDDSGNTPVEDLTSTEAMVIDPADCNNGFAGIYPCEGYDLLGGITLLGFDASSGNDIWGWTDPLTAREYALVGLDNGTAFVDITDETNLVYLGKLPTATESSNWRDIKVYLDHAYIVSEASDHGMQVFDLTRLRNVSAPPQTFTADNRYTGFGNSHNLVINEETGFAYAVGTARDDAFSGGVHFLNLQDPKNPIAVGGYGNSGYTHDAQVVSYTGPDTDYAGSEIFIGANESSVVIVNITDKANPGLISSFNYPSTAYTHQGWFTEDQRFFILGDELDELNFGFNSRTLVFDLTDLDNPVLHTTYSGPTEAIDHNGYVIGNQFFMANYTAGLRVLDLSDIQAGNLLEEGFFDTLPANDLTSFNGVWSVYPYFSSGKIVLGDINSGLFVLRSSN